MTGEHGGQRAAPEEQREAEDINFLLSSLEYQQCVGMVLDVCQRASVNKMIVITAPSLPRLKIGRLRLHFFYRGSILIYSAGIHQPRDSKIRT